MNNELTEILFILDRSGSMSAMQQEAMDGFNRFLADQAGLQGQARMTLVMFDHLYEVAAQALPVQEITPLDERTFVPRGSTALLDAIGRGVDDLGERLAQTPEHERPCQVIVAILTDGQENASEHFSWRQVQERITHQTTVYNWQFYFLGANQDAIATASLIGIAANASATFASDGIGAGSATRAVSRKLLAMRKRAAKMDLSVEEAADIEAPMDQIVSEEDRSTRGK
jgi:Mg-chelatase subunit ChlD